MVARVYIYALFWHNFLKLPEEGIKTHFRIKLQSRIKLHQTTIQPWNGLNKKGLPTFGLNKMEIIFLPYILIFITQNIILCSNAMFVIAKLFYKVSNSNKKRSENL